MGALAVPTTAVLVVAVRFVAAAVTAVARTGAVPGEGNAFVGPDVVEGAVTTRLLTATVFVNGVVITGTVVPAGAVAEVIVVAALGALTVAEAAVTAGDPAVGTTIADTLPTFVIAGTGVELTELFTASCGLAIGGTYCPVACSAISLL